MTISSDLLDNVYHYLQRAGWVEQEPGQGGSLWRHRAEGGRDEAIIAVPRDLRIGEIEWRSVIERLAAHEQRPVEDVAAAIRDQFVDATLLRAANDPVVAGAIPLAAGASLISSVQRMLRASATTAQRPRAHIAGNFSKIADEIADKACLGHTQEGSFVIPVLMPLTEPPPESQSEPPIAGLEVQRVAHEPTERRVMRTFAEALTAVQRRIVEPGMEPRRGDMGPLVAAGASREFVVALHHVLANPTVAGFEATFQWAGAVAPPRVPARVALPREAEDLLQRTALLLRSSQREPAQVITGPIVEVRHMPGDPFGEIAVQTTRRGRPSEVRVRLREAQLDLMHEWMRGVRTVVVEGPLVTTPGKPLRVNEPTNVSPLDESFLPIRLE